MAKKEKFDEVGTEIRTFETTSENKIQQIK
jgi:hypothetical protein